MAFKYCLHALVFIGSLQLIFVIGQDIHSNGWMDSHLKLAYGSMLNVSCLSNDDCLLKHSICDQLTKRCECDYGTIQGNSRCEIMVCTSSEECLTRFPNTICMFGRCQCRYGLKANGQCVQLEVESIKHLPEWAISAIAICAMVGGVLGGRSQIVGQVLQHIVAIVALVTGQMTRFTRTFSTRNVKREADNNDDDLFQGPCKHRQTGERESRPLSTNSNIQSGTAY